MNLTLLDIVLWSLIAIGLLWWWRGHAVREQALRSTRRYCEQMGVQLLDETVVLTHLWPKRDGRGHLALRRVYEFEFTATGTDRFPGSATMLGPRLADIQLAPHRI